jgi:hypothetical protein
MKRIAELCLGLAAACVVFPAAANAQTFVGKQGTKFVYQGNNVTFYGSTFYPSPIGGTAAWHSTSFPSYIDQMIARAQQAGQNILRPTDFWAANTPNQDPQDPVVWANMDYLVSACKKHGMFVLMDISAFKWLLTANGQTVTDPNNWNSFIDFVSARYANEPTVAFWSIMGEPAVPTTTNEADSLVAFYDGVTTRLRNDDPNHLICAGGFNHMEDHPELSWWQRIYSLTNNDIPGYKTYSQHDLDLMPTITNYTNSINKPAVDEEFGMPQYTGDCSFSGTPYNGISTSRADFFKNVYNEGVAGGAAGFEFWNLGDEVASSSYEVSPSFPCLWAVLQQYSPPAQPPQGLVAGATNRSQINLAWNANAETTVTGYNVYRSTTSGFTPSSGNRIASGVAATSYFDTGLSAATNYYYLISAVNQLNKESGPSNQASATTVRASATVNLVSSANPVVIGSDTTVTFTATVTGAGNPTPTGTVDFRDFGNSLSGPVPLVSGVASLTVNLPPSVTAPLLTQGAHSIVATYAGDAVFSASTSNIVGEVVKSSTQTTSAAVAVSVVPTGGNPLVLQIHVLPFTLQAQVTPPPPAGESIIFYDGNVVLGTSPADIHGIATYEQSGLSVGPHSIQAVYSGDAAFAPSIALLNISRSPKPH